MLPVDLFAKKLRKAKDQKSFISPPSFVYVMSWTISGHSMQSPCHVPGALPVEEHRGRVLRYETKDGLAAGCKATTSIIWPFGSLGQQTNQIITLDTADGQGIYHLPALVRPPC